MKTENTIGLVGLVAVVGIVAFFSARYDSLVISVPFVSSPTTNTTSGLTNTSASASPSVNLDVATVARHSSASDCWIIVSKGVYAVTGYLTKHPGGASRIIPYCGKDATTAFATRGGNGTHSSSASADLAALRLGTLGSTTTANTITQVNANVSTLIPQSGEREDEDDD
ncbi:MAG: cytochrome b5-like heme/steroid binding domain-containing protein [Patescibacteria group bacterium]